MVALLVVVAFFSLILPPARCLDGLCNSYEFETKYQGYQPCAVNDSNGEPMIGVGFHLKKQGAKDLVERVVGANFSLVANGSQCLLDSQIKWLFNLDMDAAVSCVEGWISNWSDLGTTKRQSALADMAFSLGCDILKEFNAMKAAIEAGNYAKAAEAIQFSEWCQENKKRCVKVVNCML